MYLASLGEAILVLSLWLFIYRLIKNSQHGSTYGSLLLVSLLFVSITASIGGFRFAGVDSVVAIHDLMSLLSKQFAMVIYAFCVLLLVVSEGKARNLALRLFLLIFSVNVLVYIGGFSLPALVTDAFIFTAFVLLALLTKQYVQVSLATGMLLLVPATALITYSTDLSMAVFHLFLAVHFYLVGRIVEQIQQKEERTL